MKKDEIIANKFPKLSSIPLSEATKNLIEFSKAMQKLQPTSKEMVYNINEAFKRIKKG